MTQINIHLFVDQGFESLGPVRTLLRAAVAVWNCAHLGQDHFLSQPQHFLLQTLSLLPPALLLRLQVLGQSLSVAAGVHRCRFVPDDDQGQSQSDLSEEPQLTIPGSCQGQSFRHGSPGTVGHQSNNCWTFFNIKTKINISFI